MPCGRCHHHGRPPAPRRCVESMTMGRSRGVQASPRGWRPLGLGLAPCGHPDRSRLLGRHARCFEEDPPAELPTCLTPRKRSLYQEEMPCPNSIPPPTRPNCPHFKSVYEPCEDDEKHEEQEYDDDDLLLTVTDSSTQTRGSCGNQKNNIISTRDCPTMTEPCAPMLTKTTTTSRPCCPLSSPSYSSEPRERNRRVYRKSSRKPRWHIPCSSQTEKTCVGGAESSVCTETDNETAEECTGMSCEAMNEKIQVCIPPEFVAISACSPSDHGTTCQDGAKIQRARSSCASCNTEHLGVDMSCSTCRKSVSFNPSCCSMKDRKRTGPCFSFTGDINQSSGPSCIETDVSEHACLCSMKYTNGNAKKCMTCRSDEDNLAFLCKKKETMNAAGSNVIESVSAKNSSQGGSGCCCKISDYFKDNDTNKQCECVYPPAFSQLGCTGNLSGNCSCGTDKQSNQ